MYFLDGNTLTREECFTPLGVFGFGVGVFGAFPVGVGVPSVGTFVVWAIGLIGEPGAESGWTGLGVSGIWFGTGGSNGSNVGVSKSGGL